LGEGGDDGGPPGGELVFAEGAVVGLEDALEQEGVVGGGTDLPFGSRKISVGSGVGVRGWRGRGWRRRWCATAWCREVKEKSRSTALEAGEIVGCDFFKGEVVELREVELGEVDGLAELALVSLGVG